MQFTTVFALIASATFAMAAPAEYGSSAAASPMESAASSGNMCSEEQTVSCCNKKNSNDLLDFIGGSCHAFQASMGGAVTQNCNQGSIACCPTDRQTGLIQTGSICMPISV